MTLPEEIAAAEKRVMDALDRLEARVAEQIKHSTLRIDRLYEISSLPKPKTEVKE